MKIGLLLCANLEKAQYLYKYVAFLDSINCDYDVVYWNRMLTDFKIKCNGNYIPYNRKIDSFKPLPLKLFGYFGFIVFLHKIVKENKYDKLIIFTTPTAISVFDLCIGKYKNKYLFDYRDLTKEYLSIYRIMTEKIINSSEVFSVSSPGYLSYFKDIQGKNAILCHNTYDNINFKKDIRINKNGLIKVEYWGAVRQFEYNKKICKIFGNDSRFIFVYHGDGVYKELEQFCNEEGISNISFTGRYNQDEVSNFAQETDVLFNAYETDYVTTPSLAVKVYDSLVYKLPLIVSKNTFMEKYLDNNSFVFVFSLDDDDILDKLYNWYINLNARKINDDFIFLQKKFQEDENVFRKSLKEFALNETNY